MSIGRVLCCLLLTCQLTEGKRIKANRTGLSLHHLGGPHPATPPPAGPNVGQSVFRLYSPGGRMEDWCTLDPFQAGGPSCPGFNSSRGLIVISPGWSLDGMMESWVLRLASGLEQSLAEVNVVVTDWLRLAHQHYPIAVQNTRAVGKDVATLLRWLQDHYKLSPKRVHLIGYSLGAHISGFAGSYFRGSEKLGRITGLDPAGPLFEGMSPVDRLSPDDADFVDAVHTFTQERMGLSVGIKQPVAHQDFYPNGGTFQPGCDLHNIYHHITEYGLHGFEQTVKCAHERSVHLLIDSLLHRDRQSVAYVCRDHDAFEKGLCLDCRRRRCPRLGYHAHHGHGGTVGKKLFLKTRARMPYKLYHYQFKVQFTNHLKGMRPSLIIALTGTNEEIGELPIQFEEEVSGNRTYAFLITLERDIGDLMMLRVQWQSTALWKSVWTRMHTILPWGNMAAPPQLSVGRISVKVGETQKRTSFCPATEDGQHFQASEEKLFVRCQENHQKQRRKKHNLA
ncbi:hepatic triacylglycerol lipase [Gadus macrocephalus]|uniref:hepatic triacylglycerol lipase n=1 Tax=Gadus macrocephalus TaxID=80720 RepID=UPI0028CB404A|nr:hepatic triacylglycerol lipase [Gadus macrocephalus]